MKILIALDLDDDALSEAYGADVRTTSVLAGEGWDDLVASLDARADEFYCGPFNVPVHGRVLAAADFSGDHALRALLSAAEVGADGIDDDEVADHVVGSLVTFRQHLEAQV